MARLILRHNGVTIREYRLAGERMTVGRRSDNQIQLDDPTVSGIHAIFMIRPDAYFEEQLQVTLVDFNSTNGVFVNGEQVTQRKLRTGDVIRIGRHELLFEQQDASAFERTAVLLPDKE